MLLSINHSERSRIEYTMTTTTTTNTLASAVTLGDVINDQATTLRTATKSENNDVLQNASVLTEAGIAKLRKCFTNCQTIYNRGTLNNSKAWLKLAKLYSATYGINGMDRKSSELIQAIYAEYDCDKTTETTWRFVGVMIAFGLDISDDKLMTINSQNGNKVPVSRSALTEFNKVIRSHKILDKGNKALASKCLNDMFSFYLEKGIGAFINEYPRTDIVKRVQSSADTSETAETADTALGAVVLNDDDVEAQKLDISLDDATALLDGKDCNKPMNTEQSDGFNALLNAVTFRDVSNAFINKLDDCTLQQRVEFYERFTTRYAEDFIELDAVPYAHIKS